MLTDTLDITINGMPCLLCIYIHETDNPDTTPRNLSASVRLKGVEVFLASRYLFKEMLVPEDSILDNIDKQVALASAEALLDTDGLVDEAKTKLNLLCSVFADYFGLADRPEGV